MKKLHLLEDITDNVVDQTDLQASNLISSMIRSEWDSVDLYNAMLITLNDQKRDDIISIIDDIISNHYIHIGQLEKALQMINDYADDIDVGKEDVDVTIS